MSDNIVRWWPKSQCTMSIASMDERHAELVKQLAEAEADLAHARRTNDKYALEGHEQREQLAACRESYAQLDAKCGVAMDRNSQLVDQLAEAERWKKECAPLLNYLTGSDQLCDSPVEYAKEVYTRLAAAERDAAQANETAFIQTERHVRTMQRAMDAERERDALLKTREADREVYHEVYMVLLNASRDPYLGALEQAKAIVEERDALRELLREAREPVWVISTLREDSVMQSRDRDRLKALVTRIDAALERQP